MAGSQPDGPRSRFKRIQILRARLAQESFLVTRRTMLFSSVYLIRRDLYRAIYHFSPQVIGKVLDVGSGSKPYESLFRNCTEYIGLDIEESGHSHVDSKIDVFYDGTHIPFEKETFDSVVSFEVFEHVFNIDELLREIHRVLKPGGNILVSAPFAWDEHEVPYDFARYTSFALQHLMTTHGFEILELRKTNSHFLAISQLFIAYVSQVCLPRNNLLKLLGQLFLIFPLNALATTLDRVAPKSNSFFSNTVLLARKKI